MPVHLHYIFSYWQWKQIFLHFWNNIQTTDIISSIERILIPNPLQWSIFDKWKLQWNELQGHMKIHMDPDL